MGNLIFSRVGTDSVGSGDLVPFNGTQQLNATISNPTAGWLFTQVAFWWRYSGTTTWTKVKTMLITGDLAQHDNVTGYRPVPPASASGPGTVVVPLTWNPSGECGPGRVIDVLAQIYELGQPTPTMPANDLELLRNWNATHKALPVPSASTYTTYALAVSNASSVAAQFAVDLHTYELEELARHAVPETFHETSRAQVAALAPNVVFSPGGTVDRAAPTAYTGALSAAVASTVPMHAQPLRAPLTLGANETRQLVVSVPEGTPPSLVRVRVYRLSGDEQPRRAGEPTVDTFFVLSGVAPKAHEGAW